MMGSLLKKTAKKEIISGIFRTFPKSKKELVRLLGFEFEMCIYEVFNCEFEYSLEWDIFLSGYLFLCSNCFSKYFQ